MCRVSANVKAVISAQRRRVKFAEGRLTSDRFRAINEDTNDNMRYRAIALLSLTKKGQRLSDRYTQLYQT